MTFEQWMETLTSAQWHNVCDVARANLNTKTAGLESFESTLFTYYGQIASELLNRYETFVLNP